MDEGLGNPEPLVSTPMRPTKKRSWLCGCTVLRSFGLPQP
jgi:hypothetical protein